jgi:hypothetical protein
MMSAPGGSRHTSAERGAGTRAARARTAGRRGRWPTGRQRLTAARPCARRRTRPRPRSLTGARPWRGPSPGPAWEVRGRVTGALKDRVPGRRSPVGCADHAGDVIEPAVADHGPVMAVPALDVERADAKAAHVAEGHRLASMRATLRSVGHAGGKFGGISLSSRNSTVISTLTQAEGSWAAFVPAM